MNNQMFRLLFILSLATIVLVGLGGFVRATGAGLACPDWPLCFGRAIPPSMAEGVFQEWAHRMLAFVVSIGTVLFAVSCFKARVHSPKLWKVAIVLLVLLAIQVVLGGLTVILLLNPFIVTAHLLVGTLFFQTTASAALVERIKDKEVQLIPKFLHTTIAVLSTIIFVQIILGGFIGSSGAALVCPDIPFCTGSTILPENASAAQNFHMSHRLLGIIIFIMALLVAYCGKQAKVPVPLLRHMQGLAVLVSLQVVIGFLNVFYLIPAFVTVTHLVFAQILLLGYVVLCIRTSARTKENLVSSSIVEAQG